MNYYLRLAEFIAPEFLSTIENSIRCMRIAGNQSPLPISADNGIAIFGSESYVLSIRPSKQLNAYEPYSIIMQIPIPFSLDIARRMYCEWKEYEWVLEGQLLMERKELNNNGIIMSHIDVKRQFIEKTLLQLKSGDSNLIDIDKVGAFFVAHQKDNGIPFKKQIAQNKAHEVLGHFALITDNSNCYMASETIGFRGTMK